MKQKECFNARRVGSKIEIGLGLGKDLAFQTKVTK